MRKTVEMKKVKLIATIFDPKHHEDENYDEIEFMITIPEDEWARLIHEGMFSIYFENVIEGYKKFIQEVTRCECYLCFEELLEERNED